jgi:azurin
MTLAPAPVQKILATGIALAALLLSIGACSHAPDAPPFSIEITGDDNMKFGTEQFAVLRGQKVSITLKNIGSMPKSAMGHNLVVLKQNVNAMAFNHAAAVHPEKEFIAPESRKDVVAHTRMLGPNESDTITFTAPAVAGNYEYICSFPGHYGAGMRGIMTVK